MKKLKKQDICFLAGLFGIGLILFWRCFYSVNTTDEAFYVGTVYRLWRGDGMLTDEWMPSQQMSSFWLYPFYALFRLVLGGNDGMILAFRLLYIVFQLVMSGYLYGKLKKFGTAGLFGVFFYLLSTAFNINSLSYNTMANSCLAALLITLSVAEKPDWKTGILCGIFASVIVMANPYAILAYLLYGVICLGTAVFAKRKNKKVPLPLQLSLFVKISLTAAVVLVIFLIFTFQNTTPERLMKNLPYIIGDQEHQQRWGVKFSDYFRYFRELFPGCTFVPLAAGVAAIFDKKRVQHGKIYLGISVLLVLPYMIYYGVISDYVPINLITVPVSFLGFPAFVVLKERKQRLFFAWYLPAMIYPMIVQLTSNTGPLAVSAGFLCAGAASVLLTAAWAAEQESAGIRFLTRAVLVLQLLLMLWLRISYVWADESMLQLDTKVEQGAAKGLYTTEERAQYYEEVYEDLDALDMKEDDGFLVVGADPLLYLYADKEVASYSTWQVFTDETRLYRYYEIHSGEGKFPTVVYCVEADETIFDSILVEKLLLPQGYEWKQMQHGIAFYTPR